ncbi:MAG: CPBP family intramembrane metalloprotease [Lentisphaeria bacterium]|nr:CPBP family intramembrane metalloprotease [Lentisphaeria bacterium]
MREANQKTGPVDPGLEPDRCAALRRSAWGAGMGFLGGLWAMQHLGARGDGLVCRLVWGLLPIQVGAFGGGVFGLVWGRAPKRVWEWLGLSSPRGREVALALPWYAGTYPAAALLGAAGSRLWQAWGMAPTARPFVSVLQGGAGPGVWLLVCAVAVLVAPCTEELLFRVVVHDALAAERVHGAAVWTSLLFASVHGIPEYVPSLWLLGFVLQRLRGRTGSLWPCLVLHALFNATSMALLLGTVLRGGLAGP